MCYLVSAGALLEFSLVLNDIVELRKIHWMGGYSFKYAVILTNINYWYCKFKKTATKTNRLYNFYKIEFNITWNDLLYPTLINGIKLSQQ